MIPSMKIEIEFSLNYHYQLLDRCRSTPSYTILKQATFRQNPFGITEDKFAVRCTLQEAGQLLELARQHSLSAASQIEKAIRTSNLEL